MKDLDTAVEFYRDVVGLALERIFEAEGEVTSRLLGYDGVSLKVAFLNAGNGHALELIQYVHPPGAERSSDERNTQGATHLAFDVDDIETTFQRLIDRGARRLNPPVENASGRKLCYLRLRESVGGP